MEISIKQIIENSLEVMQGCFAFKRHLDPPLHHPCVACCHPHSLPVDTLCGGKGVSFSLWNSPLKHGIQQQPQVTSMAATTDSYSSTEASSPLHRPKHFSIMPVKGMLIHDIVRNKVCNKKFQTFYTPLLSLPATYPKQFYFAMA